MSLGLVRKTVRLEAHDPLWDRAAREAIALLRDILGPDARDIQHVGSTAIPSVRAKPIVDIAVGVNRMEDMRRHDEELAARLAYARSLGMEALVETHTAEEIRRAVAAGAKVIGVNCRDLKTFHTDPAITAGLLAQIPEGVVKIAESGIRGADDIRTLRAAGADGFLVGESLMRAERPGEALKELMK